MFPEICQIGPFTVFSYGLMLVLAFFSAGFLARRQAVRDKVSPEKIFDLCFLVFISGIVGCRVFYVMINFAFYLRHPLEIIMLQHGGMAIFGGLISGAAAGWLFVKKNKMSLLKTLDLLVPFVALGQAVGRVGCLLNGCCFGKASKFGLYFPVFDQVLIPTQLYSSLLMLLIFIILRFMQDSPHSPGAILYSYLFLYSLKRFFIEFLRNDSPRIFYGLTLFQLLSLSLFFFSLFMIIRMFRNKKK